MKNCPLAKLLILLVVFSTHLHAQTTVNSLLELLPYLKNSDVNIKLAPGTYEINAADIDAGTFGNPLFLFEGNNSTYDFTGVTLNINTEVFQKFGDVDVKEIQILGNNNVLNNLTMVDIGSTRPTRTALGIAMDGRENRIEGFHITVRGSHPYGYGDAFGKGGTGTIIKHYKHSGVLIRGLRNHLKNCNVISRSYGHIVFMQAASYPTIEGCYIEGEMRSTDDMLAETSGQAFDAGFMTTWGYTLPGGYVMSLQEEGIRAYNAGTTYIDGVEIQRGTDNPTILNCTIKNARGGVTLSHASGTKYVENCIAIGCEQGFAIGSGTIVNSSADAQYGPVYGTANSSDTGVTADITILAPSDNDFTYPGNGSKQLAYIGGNSHDLTFRNSEINPDQTMHFKISGINNGVRNFQSTGSTNNLTSTNIKITNLTEFPVVIEPDASGTYGSSCGPVTDHGINTNIVNCGEEVVGFPDPSKAYRLGNNRFRAFAIANDGDHALSIPYHADIVTSNIASYENLFPGDESYWVFTPVAGREGYFFIDCFECESKPRLTATTNNGLPVMMANTVVDDSAQWSIVQPEGRTTYHITNDYARIIGANTASNQIILSNATNTTNQSRFEIIEVSGVSLSVEKHKLEDQIALYPVPFSNILNVKIKNDFSTKVDIISLTGQIITSKQIKNSQIQIDLTHIPSGIYIAKFISDDGTYSKKIVKQ